MDFRGKKFAVIGAGSIGEALIRGWIKSEVVHADQIVATAPRAASREHLAHTYGVTAIADNRAAVALADVVLLSVKPQIFGKVLVDLAGVITADKLIISIAAGITTQTIEARLVPEVRVCRAMPNMPAVVSRSATAVCTGRFASDDDLEAAKALFQAVGTVTVVDETLLDAATGLSGCGPAYVFMIIEALADAGVKVGLPRYQAQALAAQTVAGSARLLLETGEHPGVMKDRVTSPGGAAIVGLHTLEEGGLRTTLINAVVAATQRSTELGAIQANDLAASAKT
jgi:pyrroline-5-carboxylate reductase